MSTQCLILRTNRTMTKRVIKDSLDDFTFEKGLYFVRREKVFLWKTSIRGKIRPTLLYIEGISEPLYLDNLKIKEYFENVIITDEKTNKPIYDDKGKIKTIRKSVKRIEDIFIDSRAIHNMTDKKILDVLSAQSDITGTEIIILLLLIVSVIIGIVNLIHLV